MTNSTSDFEAMKAKLKAAWMTGDFGQLAKYNERDAEQFIIRRDIKPGIQVLDVACGTGNLAIPAAKAGASVTGVDFATNLLEQARSRAKREGVNVQFDEGDAEELPYSDASFDLVVSMYGVMFAPRPEHIATELLRVCRPGGEIALANWTPNGFVGQMSKITAKYVPPPPLVPSPALWGNESTVRERFRNGYTDLQMTPVMAQLRYPFSVPETVEFFRLYYGPMQRAFAALDDDKQAALRHELEDLWVQHNLATDGTTYVQAEYLEVVATRA